MIVETEKTDKSKKKKKDSAEYDSSKYVIVRPVLEKIEIVKNIILTLDEMVDSNGKKYNVSDIILDIFNEDYEAFCEDLPIDYLGMASELFESLVKDFADALCETEQFDEAFRVIDIRQRRKKALTMRKYKAKIQAARKRALRRRASQETIKLRANRAARRDLKKRFAQGKSYAKMTPSERMAVDRRMKNVSDKVVGRLATQMIQKVRKREASRMHTSSKGDDKSKKINTAVVKSAINKASSRLGKEKLKESLTTLLEELKFTKADLPKKSDTCGIKRSEMPQVDLSDLVSLKRFLTKKSIGYEVLKLNPNDFEATQKEFNIDKVNSILKNFDRLDDSPILVSKDGYIIDGHHRWLAYLKKEEPINVMVIDKKWEDVLDILHEYPKSFTKEIHENKG